MTQKTARVTARVPEELLRQLEGIMDRESIDSISEALRQCIETYITTKTTSLSAESIVIDIGMDILSDIDTLVDIGRVSDREEAFKYAIKTWTETHMEKYVVKRDKLYKTVADTKSKILEARGQKLISS
ncbi:MAG: ribbon-helix-helix protein, CopG family, partial [Thermoplasmata archaeon]